ncbi:MAG: hypothetical protein KatS3mg076_2347 [Candidatus Binatia bacterium]|nr:MAG: hypothetical protein KatS3mg076_2347 [Candidatus Binatia bacterium]
MVRAVDNPGLYRFFLRLVRQTFDTLGVGGPTAARYVAEVCTRFARSDRLYALSDPAGRRIADLVRMSEALEAHEYRASTLDRYVGDFALFMSGLFRRYVAGRGVLGLYHEVGARSYLRASLDEGSPWPPPKLLAELGREFERYAGALDFLRQAYFVPAPGEDPFRGFLARLAELTGGPGRN